MDFKIDSTVYKPRVIDKTLERYLKNFGAVCVEGPKWCGKTWTSLYHAKSNYMVGNPANNFQNRKLAELSPETVLEGDTPRALDEWQEVPQLWDAVRNEVDKRACKNQFILTGSSTPERKGVLHSGAGRIARLRMRTMSLYESGDSSGKISLEDICNGKYTQVLTGQENLKRLTYLVARGGWPGNLNVSAEDCMLLPNSYVDAILTDDARRIDNIRHDTEKMRLLLRSLARNESTTVSVRKLKEDIRTQDGGNVDEETVSRYLDMFERLFLLDNQRPFSTNIRSSVRVKQGEKRHFCDPAIACALLRVTPQMLINDLETFGFLFEAMCERDLKIYAESFGGNVYHYQDYSGKEIDAVVELSDGRWTAFEIKLGAGQIDRAAENLVALRDSIKNEGGKVPTALCVICGMSNAAYVHPSGVYVVPITALKN